jgi:uncharacterized membrane protein YraQ (UPF0718 family)
LISDTAVLIGELLVLFFSVAFLVHISQRWLGEERLRRWMGGRPVVAALKGIGVGFMTPFCTYSAIPMLVGLRRAGVAPAGYVAFIVAAPVLDPVLFGALVLIVGLPAAFIYVAVAFTAALALALVAERAEVSRFMKPVAEPRRVGSGQVLTMASANDFEGSADTCEEPVSCSGTGEPAWLGLRHEVGPAAGAAFSLLRALGPILVAGVAIGLAIQIFVPGDFVASVAGGGSPLAIPIAAGLGTPLYFNTGLFVPIADSLAAVGVGIGAIVALTIAGAGANVPEFVILGKLARPRVVAIFVGYVFAVAVVGGMLAQLVV